MHELQDSGHKRAGILRPRPRPNADQCTCTMVHQQQLNSMLHKTETELPKQHAILKPQAGQASEVEANAERQPKHPHGDNHLCYGAGVEVERSSITPRSS
ncbi:hypothetical protein V6N12_063756 [Hibiscus sabdariffa]|uniref:Uncharacterized protein n=1 Tax=Hibiscus sabdariffa TaxID=183260 RepID=A0ABR2B782_9ROSI